ncbi:MAG: tetratricopeptide repeat protein, partial [Candidatus Omnitrophica bacterium]|nr:tetratricopeptide repeat protein [Candidatus Omnitrophota bacterium]
MEDTRDNLYMINKPPTKDTFFLRYRPILIAIFLISIFGSTVYVNSLNNEFTWDDEWLVENNVHIRNWSNTTKIFMEDVGAGAGGKYHFYRPVQIFTYMIDYSLWKLNVRGYHFTSILLHILAALTIYWLINILFKDNLLSLCTSILFVVHPIHTEAVTYISGRSDSLATIFMLVCIIFYIKYLRRAGNKVYIFMIISYTLALLSKENSLILPALILLYTFAFKEKLKVKGFLPIVSIAFIFVLLRSTVLESLSFQTSYTTTLFQRIPGFFVAITNYIRLMFLPFNLHMEYGNKLFNLSNPKAMAGLLILVSLLIYAFRKKKANVLIFFSIFWFFIALLSVSNLYPINAYMAEHWMYLPSIGFFLILSKGLNYIYRTKNLRIFAVGLMIGLLAFYSYLTLRQNNYWKEPIAFYERILKYAPDSCKIYNNLGVAYMNLGNKKEAISSYKKAIEIDPDYSEAYNNLGVAY